MSKNESLRHIPSVEQMLCALQQDLRFAGLQHAVLADLLRQATQRVRLELSLQSKTEGGQYSPLALRERIFELAMEEKSRLFQPSLRKVVNGTGVVLHTNLGRAPLSARARDQVLSVMKGYSTLEYDLTAGMRGERYSHVAGRLESLTGAEAAIAVNNNAAAVLLVLAGIARGREVIVSRGELVEIGGSFRIPDVIRQSGAILVEVGTTNKTRLADYEAAISANTAAILKVHTSNFAIVGFTSQPSFNEIVELCRKNNLISINDVGSGTLLPLELAGHHEPTVQECLDAGFDLVTFSGDKLLGAGQAGIIAGRKRYIEKIKQEPLLRAVRIDKLSLAALEGTLIDYATGNAGKLIPGWEMLKLTETELRQRAEKLLRELSPLLPDGWQGRIVPTSSLSGGGSLPAVKLRGYGIEILPFGRSASQVEALLRDSEYPVIALIRENALVIDVRCLRPGDEQIICAEIVRAAGRAVE